MNSCVEIVDRDSVFSGFKISYDQLAKQGSTDPWMRVIYGRYGHVYPHSEAELAATVKAPRESVRVLRRRSAELVAIPGVAVHQRGDFEATVTFAPSAEIMAQVDKVLKLQKARTRKPLTEEQREAASKRLAEARQKRAAMRSA